MKQKATKIELVAFSFKHKFYVLKRQHMASYGISRCNQVHSQPKASGT